MEDNPVEFLSWSQDKDYTEVNTNQLFTAILHYYWNKTKTHDTPGVYKAGCDQKEGSRQGGGDNEDGDNNINNGMFMEVYMTEDELREWEESNAAGMVMGGRWKSLSGQVKLRSNRINRSMPESFTLTSFDSIRVKLR